MTAIRARILMELRTCFEGFAGIPQETRLLFSAFQRDALLQVDGLINHTGRHLGRALRSAADAGDPQRRYDRLSRFVVSTISSAPANNFFTKLPRWFKEDLAPLWLALGRRRAGGLPLDEFDGRHFPEFLWDTLYAPSLPSEQSAQLAASGYRTLAPSWRSMHRAGLLAGVGGYPRIDTRGYDLFLAQTPYPARLAAGTRLVVRYHDAIPIFLPHTIPSTRFHRRSHMEALRDNAPHATFVCTSEAVRGDLLRMFPQVENRSPVIHDVVSEQYFAEDAPRERLIEIIRSRLDPAIAPKLPLRDRTTTFAKLAKGDAPLRFLLMVSSVEPRKNHLRLVQAWEQLRLREPGLRLVIVGTLGWDYGRMVDAFRPWIERGELFHLSGVPFAELRLLYRAAACVVCPSIAEGFDLSGVEAMLCGGAVAASDIAVHREVYGEQAGYFDRYSADDLANVVGAMLHPGNRGAVAAMRERGREHAQRYREAAIAPQWADLFGRLQRGPTLR